MEPPRTMEPDTSVESDVRQMAVADLDVRFERLRVPSPPRLERLRRRFKTMLAREPILVTNAVELGKYVVVDRFKRLKLAIQAGADTVLVRVCALSVAQALAAMLRENAGRPGVSERAIITFTHGIIAEIRCNSNSGASHAFAD